MLRAEVFTCWKILTLNIPAPAARDLTPGEIANTIIINDANVEKVQMTA